MSMIAVAAMAQVPRPTPMAAGAYTREPPESAASTPRLVTPKNTEKATRLLARPRLVAQASQSHTPAVTGKVRTSMVTWTFTACLIACA